MKITRFAQSCLVIETKGKRILIDPGAIQYDEKLLADAWKNIDAILVTHIHSDHCHEAAIQELTKNPNTTFYSSREVATHYPDLSPKIVTAGETISVGEIVIEVVKAIHGYVSFLKKRGVVVNENIGFIVDDGDKRCYVTSDTIGFDHDYRCDVICVPVGDHGLTLGTYDSAFFIKETGASLAIPTHYDNPLHPVDIEELKRDWEAENITYKILKMGESVEI